MAAVAVDGGLQIDLAHTLQGAGEDGVDGHLSACMRGFDVALAELRREAFEQPDLLVPEFNHAFGGGLLKTQEPFMLGQQAVALPDRP